MLDVWSMLIFGILAFLFGKIELPVPTFPVEVIPGGDLEQYFMDSLNGNNKSLMAFFTRAVGWAIWVLIILTGAFVIWDSRRLESSGMRGK